MAQDRPVFFPEDVDHNILRLKCLCKPGVVNKSRSRGLELSFLHTFTNKLEEEEGFPLTTPLSKLSLQNIIFKLRGPIINREGFKLIIGIRSTPEQYNFQRIGADYASIFKRLDDRDLKSAGFDALVVKSWNERVYTSFRVRNLYNGDYDGIINFSNRYAIFNVSGIFGIKQDDYKEWGIGLSFSKSFRRTIALPFLLYNQTLNEKWGLEMILPALISVRRNLAENSILLLGTQYNSRSYSIEIEDNASQIFNLNHSEIRTSLMLEQRLHPWIWMDFTFGFQYNFSTDFEAKDDNASSFQVEPGSAPFFKIGIFVSPPDSFTN